MPGVTVCRRHFLSAVFFVIMGYDMANEDFTIEAARLGLQYMATIGLSGKPKVHPAQYMTLRDRNDFTKPEEFSL